MEKDNNQITLSLLKSMLYREICSYNEHTEKINTLEDDIEMGNYIIDLFENEKFQGIKDEFLMLNYYIPYFFSLNEIASKKILDNIYRSAAICNNYVQEPYKYYEKDYNKARQELRRYARQLKQIINLKTAELLASKHVISKKLVFEYKKIIRNLKFNKLISSEQYNIITEFLIKKGIPPKDQIALLERIKKHNIGVHYKGNYKYYDAGIAYKILNMLGYGYEQIEIPMCESDRKNQLDSLINTITLLYTEENSEGLLDMLPYYEADLSFSDNYDLSEFTYLINSLLKFYQKRMVDDAIEMNVIDNYQNKEYRDMLVKEYHDSLNIYLTIRNHADKQYDLYENDLDISEEKEDINNLFYATKGTGADAKTYFESDIKDLPKDLYLRVETLLEKFKKGKLSHKQIKGLTDLGQGITEMRDDQIRIVFKHVKDNDYVIIGIMLKKEDRGKTLYSRIAGRDISNMIGGKEFERELFNTLENKKHSGGRKDS